MSLPGPGPEQFENVACYLCGSDIARHFITGEDDLTGKPGRFSFQRCSGCRLVYQRPRLRLENIKPWYDDEYIAHRKKTDWGWMTPLYRRAMDRLDRAKSGIVSRYVELGAAARVLDVGCGAGTFLLKLQALHQVQAVGVDFKDLSALPAFDKTEFRWGLFYEQDFGGGQFDLITMWHFLEHDYDPMRSLRHARDLLAPRGRLVVEVPRLDSVTFRLFGDRWPGLQAPQHTALYTRDTLLAAIDKAGLKVVDYLPYGAFPAYFYLFSGVAFKLLRGRGLNLDRAVVPYFLGQILLSPMLAFERQLNLAMQTVVCGPR
jgi:SAM-dependent methyltransferase